MAKSLTFLQSSSFLRSTDDFEPWDESNRQCLTGRRASFRPLTATEARPNSL